MDSRLAVEGVPSIRMADGVDPILWSHAGQSEVWVHRERSSSNSFGGIFPVVPKPHCAEGHRNFKNLRVMGTREDHRSHGRSPTHLNICLTARDVLRWPNLADSGQHRI